AGIPLLDATSAAHGSASVSLVKGTVKMKVTALAQLPAVQPLGATFDAYVYKAYLTSSTDAAGRGFVGRPLSEPEGRGKGEGGPQRRPERARARSAGGDCLLEGCPLVPRRADGGPAMMRRAAISRMGRLATLLAALWLPVLAEAMCAPTA